MVFKTFSLTINAFIRRPPKKIIAFNWREEKKPELKPITIAKKVINANSTHTFEKFLAWVATSINQEAHENKIFCRSSSIYLFDKSTVIIISRWDSPPIQADFVFPWVQPFIFLLILQNNKKQFKNFTQGDKFDVTQGDKFDREKSEKNQLKDQQ